MTELTITIPLPGKILKKNAKAPMSKWGHIGLNKAIAKARGEARVILANELRRKPDWARVRIDAEVWLGTSGRKMDPHNVWVWLRATLDGLQDALGIDDVNFVTGDAVQHWGAGCDERKLVLTIREAK